MNVLSTVFASHLQKALDTAIDAHELVWVSAPASLSVLEGSVRLEPGSCYCDSTGKVMAVRRVDEDAKVSVALTEYGAALIRVRVHELVSNLLQQEVLADRVFLTDQPAYLPVAAGVATLTEPLE